MNPRIDNAKAIVDAHHAQGYKFLVVGQPLAGMDVFKETYSSCIGLFNAHNLQMLMDKYRVGTTVKILSTFPIDANRNQFIEESLAIGADYVFFMDMDMTFPHDALEKLFEIISDDKPIVSGMYYLKKPPYSPVMGRYVAWEKEMIESADKYKQLGFVSGNGDQLCMFKAFTYFDDKVPFTADVIGLGCVLMKTSVFREMREFMTKDGFLGKKKFFHYSDDPRDELNHRQMDEVMPFCANLKKMGIPIYIDPRVQCGHITRMVIDYDMFKDYRESAFDASKKHDAERFAEKILPNILDIRGEA